MNGTGKPMSVGRAARAAAVLIEKAAIVEHIASTMLADFSAHAGRSPTHLLQRRGEGARPADADALVELSLELSTLASEHRTRARSILDGDVAGVLETVNLAPGAATDEVSSDWEAQVVANDRPSDTSGFARDTEL